MVIVLIRCRDPRVYCRQQAHAHGVILRRIASRDKRLTVPASQVIPVKCYFRSSATAVSDELKDKIVTNTGRRHSQLLSEAFPNVEQATHVESSFSHNALVAWA